MIKITKEKLHDQNLYNKFNYLLNKNKDLIPYYNKCKNDQDLKFSPFNSSDCERSFSIMKYFLYNKPNITSNKLIKSIFIKYNDHKL